jgi:hypothetical protein
LECIVTGLLAERWSDLVQAVEKEFGREGRDRGVEVRHDAHTLRLSARRPLSGGREEWVGVTLTADEVLSRRPEELAREFARTYHACT